MSKPRWIDTGVFRTLRSATRKRSLVVIVGPAHGTAQASSRGQLREQLGDADRSTVKDNESYRSQSDEALGWVHRLRQPGILTTSVSNAVEASLPSDLEDVTLRIYGPDGKGLKGAWDRKEPFVMHLGGLAGDPASLVLTTKDRKTLVKPDSRYQGFLRTAFSRTILFTGFQLDDPDLAELLDDVTRCFNGHVPANIALVPAGSADPATALRANMHYGMSIVEFPSELTPSKALTEVAHLLEELEVPKPPTGNPPRGFTELNESMRQQVGVPDEASLLRYDAGDSSGWCHIKAGVDAPRSAATGVEDFLLGEPLEGKLQVALVRGRSGDGKTTLLRRLAWSLANRGSPVRVFWRERGAGLPDNYVPAEPDGARAVFVADDAEDLAQLPILIKSLVAAGHGKARFLLATDGDQWERSGMDHRMRLHAELLEIQLGAADEDEARTMASGLAARGRLPAGIPAEAAATKLQAADAAPLLDCLGQVSAAGSIRQQVEAQAGQLADHADGDLLRRAWLGIAYVHRHGMAVAGSHLAALVSVPEEELDAKVLAPLGSAIVKESSGALRTPHPLVAAAVVDHLAPVEAAIDTMVLDLLRTLPGGAVADHTVFHAPSELIRARRHQPLPPLTLGQFFEAGEEAARSDVLFWFDRGRYESDFSRWESAISAFDHALWKSPGDITEREHNAVVQANRARCLATLGRKKEALRAVEEGLRNSPQDAALLRLAEKFGGRRRPPERGGRGGAGAGASHRGSGGGGRGGPGGGRGGPGGGRGGPGGGRGGPGGGGGTGGRGRPGGAGGGAGSPRGAPGKARPGPGRA